MDREKIIKEMEAILEQEQIKIANTVEEFAKLQKVGITRCNAEALYNANCQVIPEGAVVLTREEMETTDKIPQKIKDFYKWFIEIEKEQACKEYARRIFEKIYEKEGYYPLASVGTSQNDMIEIAKGFGIKYTPDGVKVEE